MRSAQPNRPVVAVVLSGGGARGGAHIGALRALEEAGVPIDLIVGTSFGALVGGLYASGYSTQDIKLILEKINWNDIVEDTANRRVLNVERKDRADRGLLSIHFDELELRLPTGLQSGQGISQIITRLTALDLLQAKDDFDRFPIRFRAVATDILSGKLHVFDRGSLATAIRASIAVPGILTPVVYQDTLLVDGGIANNVPVETAIENGADVVIAVDVSTPLRTRREDIQSILDVLDQVISLHIEENKQANLKKADVVITPDLSQALASNFSTAADLADEGYAATEEKLPFIQEIMKRRSISLQSSPRASRLDPDSFDIDHFQWADKSLLIDRVEIEGLKRYPAIRELLREPDQDLTLQKIDTQVAQIYGTGLFERVDYHLAHRDDQTVLLFEVQEAPLTRLGFGVRYDQDYKFTLAADLLSHNLPIRNSDWAARALVGNLNSLELELNKRRLFDGFVLSPRLHVRQQDRFLFPGADLRNDFEEQRAGVGVSLRRALGEWAEWQLAYDLERVDIDSGIPESVPSAGGRVAGVGTEFRVDTLDDLDFPSRGQTATLHASVHDESLGSQFSFRRFFVQAEVFRSPDSRNTLGLSGFWGIVGGDEPFHERFFAGGAHNLQYSSLPFAGLERDQILSRHLLNLGLSYRYRLKTFQLGLIRDIYLGGRYRAGFFNRGEDLTRLGQLVQGAVGGIYFDTQFLGPIRLEGGGSSRGDFNLYLSIGHFF